jgi:magnesium chelatase subunit I
MIDLPLGATEDRVCSTIDIEKALTEGVKAFEPWTASSQPWNSLC